MEKKCEKIGELLQKEAERTEVEKHCFSCDPCREFFREEASFRALYEKGRKEKESSLSIPEKVDMAILSRAGFAAAERAEKRKNRKRIFYAAASIAVIGFFAGLFSGGTLPGGAGGRSVTSGGAGETGSTGRIAAASWEYTDYAEGNDAVNCELFSLSAQLDMAAFEAEIAGYRS